MDTLITLYVLTDKGWWNEYLESKLSTPGLWDLYQPSQEAIDAFGMYTMGGEMAGEDR
jgi:hypothetical protein